VTSPPSSVANAFERRAERAAALAPQSPAAEGPLAFAAGLYREQGAICAAIERAHGGRPLTGRIDDDLPSFADRLGGLLRFAADRGPAPLREQAHARAAERAASWLVPWWRNGAASAREDYLARAALRPYAEVLAARRLAPDRTLRAHACPFCGGAPWIAHRRAVSDGDGGARFLDCALCGGEWQVTRIHCPSCDEADPVKLPTFQSDRYPAVRIEACANCHGYVKSIDLSLDARLIPEVDDLVSVSMDLWAADEGYTRIEPGLAGI
jgi:formate dehydrogenase maturation protein FdhE